MVRAGIRVKIRVRVRVIELGLGLVLGKTCNVACYSWLPA